MRTLSLVFVALLACRTGDVDKAMPVDQDGDGYGEDDCDDGDPDVHPDADEVCDGVDNDCDGDVDAEAVDATWQYPDADADGYGDDAGAVLSCDPLEGHAEAGGDCDDTDPAFHPGAPEDDCADPNDYNCDGSVGYADTDGDGYAACEECDDSDGAVNPEAVEVCDGIDNDCSGEVDGADAVDATPYYADTDSDTWGDPAASVLACEVPEGYAEDHTDCDDTSADVHPGADERCNEADDDCDGTVDEDPIDPLTWYRDADGDLYGDPATTDEACTAPEGYVSEPGDCDDLDPASYPEGVEVCDGADNDCDGTADEDPTDPTTWYADTDGDGYGDPSSTTDACEAPPGHVEDATDCDDAHATAHPGAVEVCDTLDNDCDSTVDEDDAVDATTWYADADDDGYGDPLVSAVACEAPADHVADDTDCDDTEGGTHPGAIEHCDGVDEDCDGTVDDTPVDMATWHRDADGDGYGDPATTTEACELPDGYVTDATDCDDLTDVTWPGADEVCDGADNDCDGTVDDNPVDPDTWYADGDGDGWGDPATAVEACDTPTEHVGRAGDCDDAHATAHPGAVEICDTLDNDCDGTVEEDDAVDATTWYADADDDGYGDPTTSVTACAAPTDHVADATDCDDASGAVHPGAAEHCDDVDEDCDGVPDDGAIDPTRWYTDADGDGWGSVLADIACNAPAGTADRTGDCDDDAVAVNPDQAEDCGDVIDNDCDGTAAPLASDATCGLPSCYDIHALDSTLPDGLYWLDTGSGAWEATCDMTSDDGGWTLAGSVVNDGTRLWDSLAVWTDSTTFGAAATRQAADFKDAAFAEVVGADLMVRTEDYAVGFDGVLGDRSMAGFVAGEYDSSTCSTTFLASGADWSEDLTTAEAELFGVVVRPWDTNASCFPAGNENAILGLAILPCWTYGLGNTPSGQATWSTHDNAMPSLASLAPAACTGGYPCNALGIQYGGTTCYDQGCKTLWAEVWVR